MRKILFVAAMLLSAAAYASKPVRVACIGDSITYGSGIQDKEHDSYPGVLQSMLGTAYVVRNFGGEARVMTSKGDHPFMKERMYQEAKEFMPDIVTIMLGTNDTKPHNWDPEQYKASYEAMVRDLKSLPSHPDIYVCLPPPVYETKWGINDSTLVAGVIPVIRSVADHQWLEIIDMYSALSGKQDHYSDNIHPNEAGARIAAQTVYNVLKDNGWTGKPGKRVVFVGDSITDGGWGKANAQPSLMRNHYDMNHLYGQGYAEYCAAYYLEHRPEAGYHFYNRGLSGDRLTGISGRWDVDVLAVQPDIVSIFVGVNDSSHQNCQTFDFAGWEKMYRELIKRTAAFDPQCKIVLCTPFLEQRGAVGRSGDYADRRAVIDRLDVIVRKLASEYGLVCVDFAPLMDRLVEKDKSGDRNYWIWDGVHPTMQAHAKMAELWIKKVGKRL